MPPTPPAPHASLDRRDWIAGLEKGLALIEVFDAEHSRLTATQVAQRCGLTRTAARRHLLTLRHLGYVDSDGKLFWLTPRVLRLGQAYLDSARLPRAVQPYLQRVAAGTGESAYAAVLDQDEVVYVARSSSLRHLHTGYLQGSRVQAHLSAAGLVILGALGPSYWDAWLARATLRPYSSHTVLDKEHLRQSFALAHEHGWALSEQQLEMNYRGVAVPLYDHTDRLLGAISVSMPMNNETPDAAVRRVLPVLQETVRAMRLTL